MLTSVAIIVIAVCNTFVDVINVYSILFCRTVFSNSLSVDRLRSKAQVEVILGRILLVVEPIVLILHVPC